MSKKLKKIVCFGGGTGLSTVLSGLKDYPVDLTAIVTMFDNGGSGGKLRKELNILPIGDIRQCLISLSKNNDFIDFFQYRFGKGSLKGHNLGNLLIAAASQITGSLEGGIKKIGNILNTKGEVLPVTLQDANLTAVLKNNQKINGEENIVNCRYLSKIGVKKLFLKPKAKASPKVISAIKKADLIIFSPGKFYTSIIPNLLVKGIPGVVRSSRAKKIFVCNLMTQVGNTDGFIVEDFVKNFEKYLGENVIDYVIFNTGKLPKKQLKEVKKVFPGADFIRYDKSLLKKKNFIGANLLDKKIRRLNPSDNLVKGANQRTMILHDSRKLAKILLKPCPVVKIRPLPGQRR